MRIVQDKGYWIIDTRNGRSLCKICPILGEVEEKEREKEKARYESLVEHHTKREVIADRCERGIQINPTELAFFSQNIDPLHSPLPFRGEIVRGLTPFHLGLKPHYEIVRRPLEIGHFPRPDPFLKVRIKFLEEVSNRRGALELDSACQDGMIDYDAEATMERAFNHKRTLLFAGDWSVAAAKFGAGVGRIL